MSGIEVVGLVLAVIPLIISGLEHYAEGAETIKVIWSYSKEFRTVARKLEAESIVFRNNLDILLQESVDSEQHKALLDDLGGDAWRQPALREAIHRRLQASYSSYLEHIDCIEKALGKLRERLHINENGDVPFSDARSFRQAYKRFNFGLKKSAYLDLIAEIRTSNAHLETLANQSRVLQTAAKARYVPDLEKIRLSAINVFESFRKSIDSSCKAPHRLSLCVKAPGVDSETRDDHGLQDIRGALRVVLHHGDVDSGPQKAAWSVVEAEVCALDTVSIPVAYQPSAVKATSSLTQTMKNVKFHDPVEPVDALHNAQAKTQHRTDEIKNLCGIMHGWQHIQSGKYIGYIHGTSIECRHGLYCPKTRLIEQSQFSMLSLSMILAKQHQRRLTNADARRIAVSLATGVLQLYDTPWLGDHWSKKDIVMIVRDGKILSKHPLVSQSLQAASKQSEDVCTTRSPPVPVIRNSVLFALGVTLIELCMEQSIDQLHLPQELNEDGSKNDLSDLRTADRLWRTAEIHDRFGKKWSDVVRRCIYCDLNQDTDTLRDVGFRKAVYENILAELEEDYRHFFNL